MAKYLAQPAAGAGGERFTDGTLIGLRALVDRCGVPGVAYVLYDQSLAAQRRAAGRLERVGTYVARGQVTA